MERSEEFRRMLGDVPASAPVRGMTEAELVADNARRREEVLSRPTSDEERRLQEAFLAGIRERAGYGVQMRARERRLVQAEISRDAGFDTLSALLSIPVELRMPTFDRQFTEAQLAVARGLLVLGYFDEALLFAAADESLVAVLEMYRDAAEEVDRRDPCGCKAVVRTVGHRSIENPVEFKEAEFPNPKLHKWMHALRCAKCFRLRMTTAMSAEANRSRHAIETTDTDFVALAPRPQQQEG